MFLAAIQRAGAERTGFVHDACGDDVELRDHVLGLLEHDADTRLDAGAAVGPAIRGVAESLLARPPADAHPTRVGSYRIIRPIGEGGFGVVYLAEQENPRRTVAVKVLRVAFASGEVARRFEYEALILGRLRHPGIAQIFEAGAAEVHVGGGGADGPGLVTRQPFLVMEYVDGPNLLGYAAGLGGPGAPLSMRERLELFARVCDAVQHAHQNGVIHRDLKPDNILVTEVEVAGGSGHPTGSWRAVGSRLRRAQPKVVDFGVARIAEADADLTLARTGAGRVMGTPAYMCPEQVAGDPRLIYTLSDIYSLGVLLYQVLTGRLPYEVGGLALPDGLRVIRVREPLPLGRGAAPGPGGSPAPPIDRALRADAEAIVRKALAKDRARRYASVAELGADLRRLLAGEPVAAKRDSAWYVLRKTLRRHRAVLAVVSMFLALLVGSSVAGWSLYGSAQRARTRATALLRDSYVSEARAVRNAGGAGRRFEALGALRRAAAIRPGPDLRDEAIACLALTDLALERELPWGYLASARGLTRVDRVATVSRAGPIRVHSLEDGRDMCLLPGPPDGEVIWIRFSPAGDYLAAGHQDTDGSGALTIWTIPEARVVQQLESEQFRTRFTLGGSQEGAWSALLEPDGEVRVLALPSNLVLNTFKVSPGARSMAPDPSGGRLLVAGAAGTPLEVFDVQTGLRLLSIPVPIEVRSPAWSPDGRFICGGGDDFAVHVWDAATGEPVRTMSGHRATVNAVWFGEGGRLVSSAWDGTTRLWDMDTGEGMLAPVTGFNCAGTDGHRILLWSDRSLRAMWWHERTPVRRLPARGPLGPLSTPDFSADGRRLAVAGACGVQLWDLDSGASVTIDERPARCAFFAPALGMLGAVIDESLVTWAMPGPGGASFGPARVVWSCKGYPWAALQPDGRRAVVTADAVYSVDLLSGAATRLTDGHPGMERPAITPDGRWVFTGTWHGEPARVVEVASGQTVLALDRVSVRGSLSPDGSRLAVGLPGLFRIYRVGQWRTPCTLEWRAAEVNLAGASAFSPDGTLLAVTLAPNELRLVDAASGETLATLPNPERLGVTDLRFSPDGSLLAITTLEREVILWRLDELRAALRANGFDW